MPDTEINNVVLKKHQNNIDFVAQHSGSLEGLFEMAKLNGISITKDPVPGEQLDVVAVDEKVIQSYAVNGLDIASGPDIVVGGATVPGGIGFMKLEQTFIVS